MASEAALYPPGPVDVPAEITRLDGAYRLRVAGMIGGLFVFLLVYLAIVAVAGLLAYWLVGIPTPNLRGRALILFLILQFGTAFAALLLWLFLFKGLFKGRRVEKTGFVELKPADEPVLFDFIRRVYTDTGSPPPRRVYVSPDVNAALVYDTSLLNLVVPPKKDLLIGFGLVNVVPLSEFKAVLAHEFGHFAQKSVGLGSYLYVANRAMTDMIYSRDKLDLFVDRWSRADWAIAIPAWGLRGVLWLVRKMLSGLFQSLNLLHLSLSRQMEFNADNVAVRVAGSDAIVHSLARLDFAAECLADAAQSLDAAADHGVFTDDLFLHQSQAAERLRRLRKQPRAGLPPEPTDDAASPVKVFEPASDGIPDRYRSHPTNEMREKNAKRRFVPAPRDDRSPWSLFRDAAELRKTLTEHFYKHALRRTERYDPRPAAEVQQFVDTEHRESTYDPKYHGLYDDRFVGPGDVTKLPESPWPREQAAAWLANWPSPDLPGRIATLLERRSEADLLHGLKSGDLALKGRTFTFRDETRKAGDVERLLTQVNEELDALNRQFEELDRDVFLAHWSLARSLDDADGDGPRERELLERYRFHMAVQGLLAGLFTERSRLQSVLAFVGQNPQMAERDFKEVHKALREIHHTLTVNLNDSKAVSTPALANVPPGSLLHGLIMDRGDQVLPELEGQTITGEWLDTLITRLEGVIGRVKRVHFKSLGSLLAFQEKVQGELTEPSPHQ